ncbi:MAG: DUF4013 domain-containing protein [Methanoregula sp.]|jgi:hypothetical protein|nr:DUF4013 domain-containing protein [Methanoregula sp.]
MEIGEILSDSLAYTKEAFVGKWVRWLIFIILGLPVALISILYQKEMLMSGAKPSFEHFPWVQFIALLVIGILLSFFASGYMVRIYRGTKPAPDFEYWGDLFLDGFRLLIVTFLWMLPIIVITVVVAAIAAIVFISAMGGSSGGILLIVLLLIAILVAIIAVIIVMLFATMGVIRFARTGSIREGIRFSKIREHIETIGWGKYIIALVVLFVVNFIFMLIVIIPSLIPVVGDVVSLIVSPLIMVFTARYYTLVYDLAGEPQQVTT